MLQLPNRPRIRADSDGIGVSSVRADTTCTGHWAAFASFTTYRRKESQRRSNSIFSFVDHYLPRGIPPAHCYVSPGMQDVSDLQSLPPAIFTCGFDLLRGVGVEYAKSCYKQRVMCLSVTSTH